MRVLVVDDDAVCRLLIKSLMEKYCSVFDVDVVIDGQQAVEQYKDAYFSGAPYDLICLDCHMTRMHGPETARSIRSFEDENGVAPCSIFVVSVDDDCMRYFSESGVEIKNIRYFCKPMNFADFILGCRTICNGSRT